MAKVGTLTLGTKVDTKGVDEGLVDIERKVTGKGFMNKFSRMFSGIFSKISSGANKITSSISKGMSSILKGFGSIFSSIEGIAGIIAKISLIGIIGMILLAANYSETAKEQLQEIGTIVLNLADVLAQLILPVAEVLVNLLYEAIKWIADLLNGWFGIDLYAKRTDKSLKNGVKSAKALRKQLLGFDEMNILNKDGSIGGLGSGSGGTSGNNNVVKTNLPDIAGSLMQRAVDACNEAIKGGGIGGGLATLIFGKNSPITKTISKINKATTLSPLGIVGWILFGKSGKSGTMKDLKEILNSTSGMTKEMANKIKEDFSEIKVSYSDGMVHVVTKTGQAVDLTEKEFKELMTSLGYETGQAFEDLKKNSEETAKKSVGAWLGASITIKNGFVGKDGAEGVINGAFDNIANHSEPSADKTEDNWIGAGLNIKEEFTGKNGVGASITNSIDKIPSSVVTATQVALNGADTLIRNYKPPSITGITLEPNSNGLQTKVNNLLKKVFGSIGINFNFTIGATSVSGGRHGAKGLIFNPPRLASGGILNRPGRGVFYGGATIAEHGREAVVPLTDSQQMALLGREIGKNVVINFTGLLDVDGRRLATTTAQVMNELEFASNGGAL